LGFTQEVREIPVLPGARGDGTVQLPNSWTIKPAGQQVEMGDFPVNIALHPSGKWAAVLHAGYGLHEVVIVELKPKKQHVLSRVVIDQTFAGLAFSPDGKMIYAGGGNAEVIYQFPFDEGYLAKPRKISVSDEKFIPGSLAIHPNGKMLFVPGVWGEAVCLLPVDNPEMRVFVSTGKDSYPIHCLSDAKGKRLFVSLWNRAAVAVIDVDKKKVVQTFATERHPTEMVLGPGDKTLFVACANSTRVSVVNVADGKGLETINCALYASAPNGNTPNSLCLTPDGQILIVANADTNNLAMFNVAEPGKARPLGFIPVGMYPTSVRYHAARKRIYVANGRGVSVKANPHGPNPVLGEKKNTREYIAGLYRGTFSVIDMPDEMDMVKYSKQAYQCSPLREDLGVVGKIPKDSPIPAKIGGASPIKHCIYIIRENRTYDQVLGDVKEGNGDPNLCIFPEKITPNAHRLSKQFVLLDNFYCDGEVSAEGHEWSMGAYCTDFVRRVWPLTYRTGAGKKFDLYPAEAHLDELARPAGGYIWDRCAEAKVTYRSYGEWIENGKTLKDPGTARVKALEGHFDPWYRGFGLDYRDELRANRFIAELNRFEKEGGMPQLSIVRLPNDHTQGQKVGKPTPTAMVAENDLALGRIVEAVTKSKFWPETAIFVIEDDAQNGSDHVDAHRTVALCISPYTQYGKVDSTMYSTASMLRTMELILGLRPMSQFDAAARPMYNAFQARPNLQGYAHLVPETDRDAVNLASAWGAKLSETFDFSKEDLVDDLLLNEVIWRSVRGPDESMPPPVRAAFVFPHLPGEDEKK
jgi:DNA-binding beta-propeller fold protein YncE